ncbi:flagella synthesis protein FlgN [Thiolapillus sp.]
MPSKQADFYRKLFVLLERELKAMGELKQILDRETTALTYERDSELLLQLVSEKDLQVDKLKELESERSRLLDSVGIDNDPEQTTDFLNSEIQAQPLQHLWEQLLSLTTQCQESNRLNGTIIKLDSQHLHEALGLLRAENSSDHHNYGPQGHTTKANASRLLGQA